MNKHRSFTLLSHLRFATVYATVLALALTDALKHSYYTRRDERSLIGPLGYPFGFLDTGRYSLTVFDFQLTATKKRHNHDSHSHTRSLTSETESNPLKNIKGIGFLLKQFEDQASFNRYMDYIQQDPNRCIFEKYLEMKENDDIYGEDLLGFGFDDEFDLFVDDFYMDDLEMDDYDFDANYRSRRQQRKRRLKYQEEEEPEGFGEVLDTVEDGIYLDMMPRNNWKPDNVSVTYNFQQGEAGFYFLVYQICYKNTAEDEDEDEDGFFDIHSRFELDFDFSNLDRFNRKSYLSSGEMNLPWLFFFFSLIYGTCLYIWHSNIQLIKNGKQGYFDSSSTSVIAPSAVSGGATPVPTVYPIHYLMGLLLTLKFCSLFFESIQYHYLRVTGHAVFFSAVYYIFAFLKGMSLFIVILLIGSGWSFVKPFLTEREKKMILGVLSLQVINNIAIIVLTQETEGEISFDRWTAILHLVDILCCCAILLPIVWQVNQLEKNLEQKQHKDKEDDEDAITGSDEGGSFINSNNDEFYEDDEVPENELDDIPIDEGESIDEAIPDERMAAKLKLFRSFYLLVIAYIYMTRIVVYLFAATLNYKHTWIIAFVVELTTFLFYASVGYLFRPMDENPYFHIQQRGEGSQIELPKIDPRTKVALD